MHGPILRLNLKTALLCYCMALYLSGTTLPILSLLKDFLSEIHHWLGNILKRKRIPHIKNRPCSKVVDWPRILNCEHKYLEHQGNMINHSSRELMLSNYDHFPGSSVVTLSFALWDTLGSKWQGCLTECSQLSFAVFFFFKSFPLINCSWMIWPSENWWRKYWKITPFPRLQIPGSWCTVQTSTLFPC